MPYVVPVASAARVFELSGRIKDEAVEAQLDTEEQIDDLRLRVVATRWPTKELVEDRSQGVQLATIQELARHD